MIDDTEITEVLADLLAEKNIGTWSTSAPYLPDQVGIFNGEIGSTPDRAIGITLYGGDDDPSLGTAVRKVQILFRGSPNSAGGANSLASRAFHALQGLRNHRGISQVTRISFARLGADDSGRQERADNYQIILSPTPIGGTP